MPSPHLTNERSKVTAIVVCNLPFPHVHATYRITQRFKTAPILNCTHRLGGLSLMLIDRDLDLDLDGDLERLGLRRGARAPPDDPPPAASSRRDGGGLTLRLLCGGGDRERESEGDLAARRGERDRERSRRGEGGRALRRS